MKLWILRPVDGLPANDNPWEPWYDKCFGFVVRTETEEDARKAADDDGGDENGHSWDSSSQKHPWLNPKYSTCLELTTDGEAELVMRDFAAA